MLELSGKPDIAYPCEWEYRIIGENEAQIKDIVSKIIPKPYTLTLNNHSKKGRFVSLHLITRVENEDKRNEFYILLSQHKAIKMVI